MEQPSPGIHGHHPSRNALCCLCHGQGELLGVWGGQQSPRGTHGSLFLLQVPRPRLGPARRWPHVALHPRHRPDPRPGPSCPPANPPSAMWYVGTGWGHGRGVAGDIPGLEWGDGGDGVTRRHRDGSGFSGIHWGKFPMGMLCYPGDAGWVIPTSALVIPAVGYSHLDSYLYSHLCSAWWCQGAYSHLFPPLVMPGGLFPSPTTLVVPALARQSWQGQGMG